MVAACLQVFCTEPYRVPFAGRITAAFFDKTGTITTDQLIARGIINGPAAHETAAAEKAAAGALAATRPLKPTLELSPSMACVIGGCHSLLQVDGRLMGDPIELAAIRAIHWHYNATTGVAGASDRVKEREEGVRQAEAALAAARRRAGESAQAGSQQVAVSVGSRCGAPRRRSQWRRRRASARSHVRRRRRARSFRSSRSSGTTSRQRSSACPSWALRGAARRRWTRGGSCRLPCQGLA